ncbi:hypothetical protein [Bacillus sp. FSL K6-6540]|uniref:hypothetical protein n=1 Tax=Bacillus sp. FSL K6-6540 TaxID=2921512 RepID=UPI0030FB0417
MVEYPHKIKLEDDLFLYLRADEIHVLPNGKTSINMTDVFERIFWDLSEFRLKEFRDKFLTKEYSVSKEFDAWIVGTIEKTLAQRQFMKDNPALRKALLPS